jgi:glycosyltransferase involved in cell wall biosynthesis
MGQHDHGETAPQPVPHMHRIAVIIPAFNEAGAIAGVVRGVLALRESSALSIDAIVVNDCSTDDTAARAECEECTVLDLPVNLGIGGAVQTGFRYAFRHGYDVAIQVDGDGQHAPEDIPALLAAFTEQHADVVVGSRFLAYDGFRSNALRRIGIRYFSMMTRLLAGVRILDSTSGFRALDRRALKIVNAYYPDQFPEPEAILLYALHGLRIVEVPVRMLERRNGRSSIGMTASVYYVLKVTLTIAFSYLRLRHRRA